MWTLEKKMTSFLHDDLFDPGESAASGKTADVFGTSSLVCM